MFVCLIRNSRYFIEILYKIYVKLISVLLSEFKGSGSFRYFHIKFLENKQAIFWELIENIFFLLSSVINAIVLIIFPQAMIM